jgi:IS605 OrfB family transposase
MSSYVTMKIPFSATVETVQIIKELQKEYSPIIRTAYNRSMEEWKEIDIREHCRVKFNPDESIENDKRTKKDSWLLQSALREGITYAATDLATKRTKKIFGGKLNFKKRAENKLSKKEWKESRLLPLCIVGQAAYSGNRKFEFKYIDNQQLIFKVTKKQHLVLQVCKLRKNYRKVMEQLELAANSDILAISIKVTTTHLFITYDQLKLSEVRQMDLIQTRHAGIDMNPNYIGLSVADKDTQILSELYDLRDLTEKSGGSSDSKESKYLNNKLNHETIQIAKSISKTLSHMKVGILTLEDLNFKQGDKGKGKYFNRLTTNVWKRRLFVNQLVKRCKLLGIRVKLVNAAYSSFIGNLTNELPDPISAAKEVSRRGYSGVFYPPYLIKQSQLNQWKKEIGIQFDKVVSWKECYNLIKNLKLKYRVPIPSRNRFQRFISNKSGVVTLLNLSHLT